MNFSYPANDIGSVRETGLAALPHPYRHDRVPDDLNCRKQSASTSTSRKALHVASLEHEHQPLNPPPPNPAPSGNFSSSEAPPRTMSIVRHTDRCRDKADRSQNLVEATIADLQKALSSGSISSVELVSKYLQRIATYDCRGACLNSIPILNPDVFEEAAASDERRAAGHLRGPLDGIPYTLKDSMKYKGMTCSTGSPALEHVIANEDSFVAEQLRKAGGVCVGRTNTPPMMASGMHRGILGRAESPYSREYLTAAFSSGSSNGSGTSTAASFAAFGLGSETVSSGRSPASNNGLVAYTPSRTVISPRGTWPLYPTCDVLVPHTRTVDDMLSILDTLTAVDKAPEGDFWRDQSFVDIIPVKRPTSHLDLKHTAPGSLKGKRIAIPRMYIGLSDPKAKPTVVSQDVIDLWTQTRQDLEQLGATILETDFPLVTNYEDDSLTGVANNVLGFPPGWNGKERGILVAYLWDDFLKSNRDPNYPSLAAVDGANIFPRPRDYIPDRYLEHRNSMDYPNLVQIAKDRKPHETIWSIDGLSTALPALEAQRKRDLEDWLDAQDLDMVVFPAAGDVGRADVDTNDASARHALQNGVKYSHGNRAVRHMGVPTVSVTMGPLRTSGMPVNLTFAGKHGQDSDLLRYAWEFERATRKRIAPPRTPALSSDELPLLLRPQSPPQPQQEPVSTTPFTWSITSTTVTSEPVRVLQVTGHITNASPANLPIHLTAHIDGESVPPSQIHIDQANNTWSLHATYTPFQPPEPLYGGVGKVVGKIFVVVVAKSASQARGKLLLLDQQQFPSKK